MHQVVVPAAVHGTLRRGLVNVDLHTCPTRCLIGRTQCFTLNLYVVCGHLVIQHLASEAGVLPTPT